MKYKNIAIFASGSGTNAENIINYFSKYKNIKFTIFCNNPNAFVLTRAKEKNVLSIMFSKQNFEDGTLLNILKKIDIDFIILAGFLWKIPSNIISYFNNKIINIHPSLLPKYGGKGMYGMNVHNEILKNKETQTGITIHFVNENYDDGNIIFQEKIDISDINSAEKIAEKIHELEYKLFPKIIEKIIIK